MDAAGLTRGAVAAIAESKAWHTAPVVMQVVNTVRIPPLAARHGMPGSGRVERYTLVLSDGLHTMEVTLIAPLRHLVRDGCVRLLWYCTIFEPLIFKLEVVQAKAALIGNPIRYKHQTGSKAGPSGGSSCSTSGNA